jgi:hypothetical protein
VFVPASTAGAVAVARATCLGFVMVEEQGVYKLMRWTPP